MRKYKTAEIRHHDAYDTGIGNRRQARTHTYTVVYPDTVISVMPVWPSPMPVGCKVEVRGAADRRWINKNRAIKFTKIV